MTKQELIKGMLSGDFVLLCDQTELFYDFCDQIEKDCSCLDHMGAWYNRSYVPFSIRLYCKRYCTYPYSFLCFKPYRRKNGYYLNSIQLTPNQFQMFTTVINRQRFTKSGGMFDATKQQQIIDWRNVSNDCAGFEELL